MPLATLSQVKAKLQIPASDTSEDVAIQAVLDAAEQYVLGRTGYTLVDTPVDELILPGQIGRMYHLRNRPVADVTAQVRMHGDATWTPIAIDVVDANAGVVVLPSGIGWPPEQPTPPWFAWRTPMWDVLRVTYTAVALNPIPADLADACAALAACWYRQQLAGPVVESTLGQVRETYDRAPIPPAVVAAIARHERRQVQWW